MPKGSKKKFICRIFVHTNTTDAEMNKAAGGSKKIEVFFRPERNRSRLNFSDEDLIWRFISSKFNLHLSFWSFFDLSSVV